MDPLMILTTLAVLFVIALACSWLAKFSKLPDVLLIVVIGMVGARFLPFALPEMFIDTLAMVAITLVAFEASSRISFARLGTIEFRGLTLAVVWTILLSLAFMFILPRFGFDWPESLLLAAILVGTGARSGQGKIAEFLAAESQWTTLVTLIAPFILLLFRVSDGWTPALSLLTGLGVGVVIAIIVLKLIKKLTHISFSFVVMVLAALLSFVLAEQLGGLGVVAVIAFGLFIANTAVREKRHLLVFEHEVGMIVTVIALLLLGAMMPWSQTLIMNSLPVLGVYFAARLVAVLPFKLGMRGTIHALFAPHDVATAVVLFALAGTTVAPAFVVLLVTQFLGYVDKSLNRHGF